MSAPATLPAGTAAGQDTPDSGSRDTARRVWAIFAGSSGNLVEWYDFYVYSFCALYFAPSFFPQGNTTTQLLPAAGVFAAGFLMRPVGGWFCGRFEIGTAYGLTSVTNGPSVSL